MTRDDIIREADAWLKMNGLASDGQTCFLMALFAQHISALAAPPEDKTHPGYVIGSHWLETAYSRICAGEAEADVLRDIGLVRITDGMVETADIHAIVDRQEALRRENERLREELRQSSIDHTRAEVERLRELLIEARGAKWLVVQNNLLDRIDAALRREEA